MGVTAVYFSPTGNTKKSVEAMAAALDPGYKTVDLTLPSDTGVSCQFGPGSSGYSGSRKCRSPDSPGTGH